MLTFKCVIACPVSFIRCLRSDNLLALFSGGVTYVLTGAWWWAGAWWWWAGAWWWVGAQRTLGLVESKGPLKGGAASPAA